MKIKIELNTQEDAHDMIVFLAIAKAIGNLPIPDGLPEGFDRGTGPLKEFNAKKVTIYSTDEKGELAKQNLNLDDSVEEVELKTIPKGHPPKGKEIVVDCGNSLSLKDVVGTVEVAVDRAVEKIEEHADNFESGETTQIDAARDGAAKIAANEKLAKQISKMVAQVAHDELAKSKSAATHEAEAVAKQLTEKLIPETVTPKPVVDVKTNDVDIKNESIDVALSQLDPKPPEEKKVDHSAAIRKLMVEVVKVHGPKGAKLAGQVVNQIAGVKDVTKIPTAKFEAVKAGLLAAIVPGDEPTTDGQPPTPSEEKPTEAAPNGDDVDY